MELLIENKTDFNISDELYTALLSVVSTALKKEYNCDDFEIGLTFVHNDAIKHINAKYRKTEKETDVLSFPLYEPGERFEPARPILLGDIVISTDMALMQAEHYAHSITREICFLTVHGLLHLFGYDHEKSPAQERLMFAMQEEILLETGIQR